MTKRWLLAALVLGLVALLNSPLLAKPGTVKTRDGQTLTGDVDDASDPASVSIIIHGVKATVDRANVLSINYDQDVNQEFQDRMSKLGPRDVKGRLGIARWALDHKQFGLARKAAEDAKIIEPGNEDVATMLDTIQAAQAEPTHPATENPGVKPVEPKAKPDYLSAEQINQVRQFEMQSPADKSIRVDFTKNAVGRYVAAAGINRNDFDALSELDRAEQILESGDPKLIRDVRIVTDPASVLEYRGRIHARVLAGCAAANCHGGERGGDFFLYRNSEDLAAWYTDFYILQVYQKKILDPTAIGPRTPVAFPMVNRTKPSLSLLLQYGLPAKVADLPHPDVAGWKPMFTGADDPAYQEVAKWMGKTLKPFPPDYGFKFDLPTGKPATQPSGGPAAPAPTPTPVPSPTPVPPAPK